MPVHVVRATRASADDELTFDVILCAIGEEEFGANGRDGGHIYRRNNMDGCEYSEREGFGQHDAGDGLNQRVMVEGT